jgi:hypothetical protein
MPQHLLQAAPYAERERGHPSVRETDIWSSPAATSFPLAPIAALALARTYGLPRGPPSAGLRALAPAPLLPAPLGLGAFRRSLRWARIAHASPTPCLSLKHSHLEARGVEGQAKADAEEGGEADGNGHLVLGALAEGERLAGEKEGSQESALRGCRWGPIARGKEGPRKWCTGSAAAERRKRQGTSRHPPGPSSRRQGSSKPSRTLALPFPAAALDLLAILAPLSHAAGPRDSHNKPKTTTHRLGRVLDVQRTRAARRLGAHGACGECRGAREEGGDHWCSEASASGGLRDGGEAAPAGARLRRARRRATAARRAAPRPPA